MESVFLRVMDMSVSAAVVITVVATLRFVLRGAPKKWRYLLWSAAAFRLACPVSFRAAFSIFRLRPPAASATAPAAAAELSYIPRAVTPMVRVSQPPVPVTGVPVPVATAAPPVQAAAIDPLQLLLTVGTYLWLAGVAVMLIIGFVRYARMKRLLADAVRLDKGVFASDAITTPFLLGLLPARIFVPAGLEEKELDYVLRHERTHLRRFDHWVKLLGYLLLSLHWFNPLVWLAFYLMSRDMEMSCDERVLSDLSGEAKDYSRTLLSFAAGKRFPAPAPLGFGESDVASRIKNALRWRRPKLWVTVLAVLLCLAAIAACTANPSSGWLEDDDAVLNYAISNYQIEGQAITGGSYLYAGSREDGSAYKKFLVYLEDGTPRILTVNGTMIKRFGKMGTAMRAKGFESEDIQNSPWMWFHSLRSEAITEAAWGESWPETREHTLSKEQLRELVSRLGVLLPEEVVPGRGGPANRYVKLTTADGTLKLSYNGGVIAIAMDDAARARYPIPEGDPSPEWVIQSGSPPFEFLYSWLDTLEFETSDEPKLPIPDIAADTKDDTVFFAFSDGSLTLRGREGKTNQDLIDFAPFTDVSLRPEDNVLSPGDPSILSDGALRPGLSIPETRLALFGYTYHSNIGEQQMQRPQIILHTAEEGSDHPVTGIYAGQLFDLNLGYGRLFTGDISGQLYDRNLVSGGSDAEILADITLTFLPNEGEDHAAVLYALLRSALTQQLGLPLKEELNGHYDRHETSYDRDGNAVNSSEPTDYVLAAWGDDTATLTLRLEIGAYYSRSLTIDFYENIHYVDQPEIPEDPLAHMAALQPEDIYVTTRGYSAPDAETLAAAMNAAAAHQKNFPLPEDSEYLFWQLEAYYSEASPYGYTALHRHFELQAGLAEDLVKVSYYDGKTTIPAAVWVEDHGLYALVRDCYRQEPVIEQEAWEKYGSFLKNQAQGFIDSYTPTGACRMTGYAFTRLEKSAFVMENEEGVIVPVYLYNVVYIPEDERRVGWSGGMGLDAEKRVTGLNFGNIISVGGNEAAVFICEVPWEDVTTYTSFGRGSAAQRQEYTLWKKAYWELIVGEILPHTEYLDAVSGPVTHLALATLRGEPVPELICYLPGGGKSAAAAVFTFEEGEVRAFNAACTFGLPLAKNAVESCFWANPDVSVPRTAAFRYDEAQGFWVLNSFNGSNRDSRGRWFRFGADRNGYLACEQLIDTELEKDDHEQEISWRINGEDVTQEEYRVIESEYANWLENLDEQAYPPIGMISIRDRDDGLPDRLAAWLGYEP
jgi:beta-lactamase regulating signal transducer with metallopeptidase domain